MSSRLRWAGEMLLSRLGNEQPVPVTLPRLVLRPVDDDAKEIAARFVEQRIIKAGMTALQEINRRSSFENWRAIGAGLKIGRDFALKSSGANSQLLRRLQ